MSDLNVQPSTSREIFSATKFDCLQQSTRNVHQIFSDELTILNGNKQIMYINCSCVVLNLEITFLLS